MKSWFLNGKTTNSAEMVLIIFLAHCLQIVILYIVRAKIRRKPAFFSKSHKNAVIRVFWQAEFISALKIKLNPTVFEKNAKKLNKISTNYFLFFCDFI